MAFAFFILQPICMLFSTDTVLLASPSRDHPGFPPISLYIVTHFGSVSHYLDLLTSFPSFMILLLLHDPSLISLLRISLPSLRFHKNLLYTAYWALSSICVILVPHISFHFRAWDLKGKRFWLISFINPNNFLEMLVVINALINGRYWILGRSHQIQCLHLIHSFCSGQTTYLHLHKPWSFLQPPWTWVPHSCFQELCSQYLPLIPIHAPPTPIHAYPFLQLPQWVFSGMM